LDFDRIEQAESQRIGDYLNECRKAYAPAKPNEEIHPLFVCAINKIGKFEYYRDIFITGTKDERLKL